MGKYEEMAKKLGASSLVDQLLSSKDLPYIAEVMAVLLSLKFKVVQIEMYEGSKDPVEHLKSFKAHMTLHNFLEEIACQAFPPTFKGRRGDGSGPYSQAPLTVSRSWASSLLFSSWPAGGGGI